MTAANVKSTWTGGNLRFGQHDKTRMLVRYNRWLADAQGNEALKGEWLLRFGAFPVTRQLQQFVAQPRPVAALIDPYPRWLDPAAHLTQVLRADPPAPCSTQPQPLLQRLGERIFQRWKWLQKAAQKPVSFPLWWTRSPTTPRFSLAIR